MKFLKKLLLVILSFIGLLILMSIIILVVDNQQTSFLKISKLENGDQKSYVITNVNVIPMTTDTVITNTGVTIKDGKIIAIGNIPNEPELPILDGKGRYLSPGLIDMHVHLWDKYELGVYLANGVTTVRNLWGQPMHLRMKDAVINEEIISPMFFTSGPKLTGPKFIGDDNLQLFTPEEARAKIADYKAQGFDLIKTYYGLTPEIYDAVLDECEKQNLEIAAHPSNEVGYSYHFTPQIKTIEHAEDIVQIGLNYQLDSVKLDSIVALYSSHPGTVLCPTQVVYYNIYRLLEEDNVLNNEQLDFMNPLIRMTDSKAQFDRWQGTKSNDSTISSYILKQHNFQLYAIRKIHESGADIVCGTDAGIGITPAGYSLHEELALYKEAGMSNYEALKTATINASKVHDFLNDFGSIEVGKTANLLLTDDNPLEDLSTLKTPSLVMVKGRSIDEETLDTFIDQAKNRNNLLASGLRYVEYLLSK